MIQTQSAFRSIDHSRYVSEFTVNPKGTPGTAVTQPEASLQPQISACRFCKEHLSALTKLRKNEILLELELQKLKSKLQLLEKQNCALRAEKVLTYEQYQSKLERENHDYWNRQDIEAELFEAKVIIELLLVSKSSHPQLKLITDESLKLKYADLLLENLRLQEKVEARDRVISQRHFYPIYHADKRISTLQKSVEFWYRRANEDCARLKGKVKEMRTRLEEDKKQMRDQLSKEMERNRQELAQVLDMLTRTQGKEKQVKSQKKVQNSTVSMVSIPEKKKQTQGKSSELRKVR